MLIKQSSTARELIFLMVDGTDHITPKTGLSPTVTLSKNGAAFGAPAGAVTEVGSGWYKVAGNTTDTNTLGSLVLHATGAAADPVDAVFEVVVFDTDDVVRLGLTALPNAAAQAAGGLYTRGVGAGQINQPANGLIDVNVENWNTTAVPAEHTAGYPIVTIKDGAGTGEIDTNAGAIVTVSSVTTIADKTGYALSVAGIAAIWDAALTTLGAAGSIGKKLKDWVLGTDNKAIISADVHTSGVTIPTVSGNVVGSIGSLSAQAKLDVNTEADTALADYDAPTNAEMIARTILSADYATSTMLTAVKAKTDVQIDPFRINTATSGALNGITLDAGASTVVNFYRYCLIVTLSGTGAGQCRLISAYSGASKIVTVSNDFEVAPDNTTGYAIVPFANVLSGPAWQVLLTLVGSSGGGGGGTSQFGGFVGADEDRTFTVAPAKLNIEGVVDNNITMPVLFEKTNLTGYTFSAWVLLEQGPLEKTYPMLVTAIDLTSGLIQVSLTKVDTKAIGPCANKKWVLQWVDSGGETRDLTMGTFQLNRF